MQTETREMYVALMQEIKYRANVIELFGANPGLGIYRRARVEFISLQLRMILENIAMACLVANGDLLGKVPRDLVKEYRPIQILKRIESINPICYPQPIELWEGSREFEAGLESLAGGQYRGEIKDRDGGDWLTREDISKVYGRLGQILHAKNPLAGKLDLDYFEGETPRWYNKIVNLVTHHKVTILNDQTMYIVVVGHKNNESDVDPGAKVQMTEWQRFDGL